MASVLVTGIGPVFPCGPEVRDLWSALLSGQSVVELVSRFDATSLACRFGGQVHDSIVDRVVDPRKKRTSPHVTQLALCAAEAGRKDARLDSGEVCPLSVGVFVGTALGGWKQGEEQYGIFLEKGGRRVNPFIVSGAGNHGAGAETAGLLGAKGPQLTFSSGCVSGTQAISSAYLSIATGEIEYAWAGGAESPLSPMVMSALARTNELSTCNDQPTKASRPFDRKHDGMVLSEGACFLVLESGERVRDRGVSAYTEILGGTTSCDAQGLYHFDETGEAGARAIHRLLQRTGVTPDQIDYVCAHANSSPAFDRKEVLVLKRAFGEFAAKIPVSSIKGVLGHPFGASGAFQTAAAALAMKHSLIPPTHNLEEPDPDCDLDLVMGEARPATIRHALITSYGYGGVNSYLLLRNPNL